MHDLAWMTNKSSDHLPMLYFVVCAVTSKCYATRVLTRAWPVIGRVLPELAE